MKLLIFTLLFSIQLVAGDNYEDENKTCVTLSKEPTVCEMMDCKYISVTNDAGEEDHLCVSSNRVKYCMKYSRKQQKCQRKGCFYDFARNLCYPHLFRFFDINNLPAF